MGDLDVLAVAGHDHDLAADRLDQRGVVGRLARPRWASRRASARKACGVCTARSSPRSSVSTTTAAVVDLLDRVDRPGHPGPRRRRRRARLIDDLVEERERGERAGRVVHDDDLGLGGHGGQPGPHRVGSFVRHRPRSRRPTARAGFGVGVGDHQHDAVGDGPSGVDRPVEDASVTELFVLLGKVATEAAAAARGDDDRPDAASVGDRRRRVS